jgi:transposase
MHSVPGRKTDSKDAQWIAELHEYGLLRPSFIPAGQVAALRARTRYRKRLIEQRTSEGQRLAKVLEDAGIKIDSVASELLGKSGRAMIEALIAGLDALVAEAAAPFAALITRLQTIPGIGQRTAEVIVAETGGEMSRFPGPAQLAAWCGLAPGNRESAGKRMRAGTRKGNRHLKAALTESAWATARTRTRPGARFRRLARRFGKGNEKKAAVAVARTLLCIAWTVMATGGTYAEQGEDFYDRRDQHNRKHIAARHQQALIRLGYQVTLIPPSDGSPPPDPGTPPAPTSGQAA